MLVLAGSQGLEGQASSYMSLQQDWPHVGDLKFSKIMRVVVVFKEVVVKGGSVQKFEVGGFFAGLWVSFGQSDHKIFCLLK